MNNDNINVTRITGVKTMKTNLMTLTCFVFILLFSFPILAQDTETTNYNNEMLGFSLSYPSKWYLEEHLDEEEFSYLGISISLQDPDGYSADNETYFAVAVINVVKYNISNLDELADAIIPLDPYDFIEIITYFDEKCYHIIMENEGTFYLFIKGNYGYTIGFNVESSGEQKSTRLQELVNNILESIIIY